MKKNEVTLGMTYIVKVSGAETKVRLDAESPFGGWVGTNLATKRQVRIRTAAKLRRRVLSKAEEQTADAFMEKFLVEPRRVREEIPSEELVIEYDVGGTCGSCEGPLMVLGALGNRTHYRCRNCGIDTSSTGTEVASK